MTTSTSLPPLPLLKSFSLTHILYNPLHPKHISIPLTLLSLSPIFLFVSYFTLIIFDRRLTVLNLSLGSILNEIVSWGLKRIWKGARPYSGQGGIGDGFGMPSSHAQAAGFLVSWGLGYVLTRRQRRVSQSQLDGAGSIRKFRTGVYIFGLVLWSLLTAYSRYIVHQCLLSPRLTKRYYLLYHTPYQVIAGYIVGLAFGAFEFAITEYIPLYHPSSILGRLRRFEEWLWVGLGGVGGWSLGGSPGGWAEGTFFVNAPNKQVKPSDKRAKTS